MTTKTILLKPLSIVMMIAIIMGLSGCVSAPSKPSKKTERPGPISKKTELTVDEVIGSGLSILIAKCKSGDQTACQTLEKQMGLTLDRLDAKCKSDRTACQADLESIFELRSKTEQQRFNLGLDLFRIGRQQIGFAIILPVAESGYAEAQYCVGILFREGKIVSKDLTGAHHWTLRAGTQGHTWAAFQLGNNYFFGQGVAKNPNEAVRWYERAAKAGHVGAQFNLGVMYLNGQGVPRDPRKGLAWIQKAADSGDKQAQQLLQRIKREFAPK